MTDKPVDPAPLASSRIVIMESLVPLAVSEFAQQMPDFIHRLAQAMIELSNQTVLPNEAELCLAARDHLTKNATLFQRGALAALTAALLSEITALHNPISPLPEPAQRDASAVGLDEIQSSVLIDTLSQAIEQNNAAAYMALTFRLSRLLQLPELRTAQNPFRPALMVRAMFDAWCKFDPVQAGHRLVLALFHPTLFFDVAPLLDGLNRALIARGVVPDLTEAWRGDGGLRKPIICPELERRDASLQNRVQRWLQHAVPRYPAKVTPMRPITATASFASQQSRLLDYLFAIQQSEHRADVKSAQADNVSLPFAATTSLRDIARDAPVGLLGTLEHNTIELLAQLLEVFFVDAHSTLPLKQFLAQLQLPLLKTALTDQEFFYREHHPARRLLDQLAQSSIGMHPDTTDPHYQTIAHLVERLQLDRNVQSSAYTYAVDDLHTCLMDQERRTKKALKAPIAAALHEEKIWQAQQSAENDIAARIETGEVAGFVEVFLETQWVRVLTLTHSVAKRKPKALANALKAMDDLIWSVKPKVSAEESCELISRLPSMLSSINAWLDAIKWDGPERASFFSSLVERHAAIVQRPMELSPHHQLHIAVNVAQKASERRLSRRARELDAPRIDEFDHLVDSLEVGRWMQFISPTNEKTPLRLVWLSPLRRRFIFCHRQSDAPFLLTADALALALREQGATLIPHGSMSTRALTIALDRLESRC